MQYDSSLVFDSEVIPGVVFTLHKPSYGRTLDFDIKNAKFRQTSRELQKRQDALREELDYVRKQWDTEQEAKLKALKTLLAKASEPPRLVNTIEPESSPIACAPVDTASIQAQVDKIENGYQYERLIDRSRVVTEDSHIKQIAEELVAIGENKTIFQMPKELAEGFRDLRDDAEFAKAESYYPPRLRWGLAKIEGIEIDGAPATADTLLQSGPTDLVREILQKIDEVNSMSAEALRNFKPPTISTAPEGGPMSDTTAEHANLPDSIKTETA